MRLIEWGGNRLLEGFIISPQELVIELLNEFHRSQSNL